MRKLVAVVAAGLLGLGFMALWSSPASAELKTAISGSIRLNAIYTDTIPGATANQTFGPTALPLTAGPGKNREADNAQTNIDARRTRLQLDMSDDVGGIKMSGRFQGDFQGAGSGSAVNSNTRDFRMRLGWGQFQTPSGWIVRFGQVRSMMSEYGDNLFGGVGDADTVDENGEWDQLDARMPGVHVGYATKFMGGDLIVGVGVQKGGFAMASTGGAFTPAAASGVIASTANVDVTQASGQDVPEFGAAVRYRTPLWAVFGRGAVQKMRVILGSGSIGTKKQGDDTALAGWLGALSAEVTPGPLRVFAQAGYSQGLNREFDATFADVILLGDSAQTPQRIRHLEPLSAVYWHAGAEYKLTKDLKATAVYEFAGLVDDSRRKFTIAATSTDNQKFQAVHAGLIYSFWTRFDTGLEYLWGKRATFGSSEGEIHGVNWRLRFYF